MKKLLTFENGIFVKLDDVDDSETEGVLMTEYEFSSLIMDQNKVHLPIVISPDREPMIAPRNPLPYETEWDGTDWVKDQKLFVEYTNAGIKTQLDAIDSKSLRAVRSVLAAMHSGDFPSSEDIAKLAEYETQANELREKLI